MRKELSFLFDASDERINGPETPMQIFGVSVERAKQLLTAQSGMEERDFATSDAPVNIVDQFVRFLESEELTAQEVAFLCYVGFTSMANTKHAVGEAMKNPMAFLNALKGL